MQSRMISSLLALAGLLSTASALQPAAGVALFQPASSRVAAPRCALSPEPQSILSRESVQGRRQRPSSQQPQPASWGQVAAQGALTVLAALAVSTGSPANAENELAVLANSKSTSELVDPQCFAKQCKSQMETCAADGDCMKGLACTAKCMGDAQCTVGCFARYNDKALEKVLQCTIEDAGCIAIATQAPGADSLSDAPKAPHTLVKATPQTMSGRWYKVLGFNPNYDCYECQRNSFAAVDGNSASKTKTVANDRSVEIGGSTAAVEVEYTMPRARMGMPTENMKFELNEKLEFDEPNTKRTAHTEGRMFGLTFWENWYLIGENQPREPEFRFVYYTGKTLQNRYEGAFVYARKPELPAASMPSIYKIAREAGLDPQRACCIDNRCFEPASVDAPLANPPPFTPTAEAAPLEMSNAVPQASAINEPSGAFGLLSTVTKNTPLANTVRDLTELLEDPKPYGVELFSHQRPMTEVREFDPNGYQRPSTYQQ